jgi:hypothetical protein
VSKIESVTPGAAQVARLLPQDGGLDTAGSYLRLLQDDELEAVVGGYTLVCLLTKNNEYIVGGVP